MGILRHTQAARALIFWQKDPGKKTQGDPITSLSRDSRSKFPVGIFT
jgi:hypothetical protein